MAHSLCDAAAGADATVVATDWAEFREMDLAAVARAMRGDVVIDTRNCLRAESVVRAGLTYYGIGRPGIGGRAAEVAEQNAGTGRGAYGVVTGV